MKKTLIAWLLLAFLIVSGALLYAGFLGRICQGRPLLIEATDTPGIANVHDFVLFYAEGKLAKGAEPGSNLYERAKYNEEIAELCSPLKPYNEFGFQYPPFFIPILKLLASMNLSSAWVLWVVLSLLIQIGSALYIVRGRGILTSMLALASSMLAFPAFSNFFEGQTAVFLLISLVLLFCLSKKESYFLAGLASSLGFFKIQFAPAIVLIGFLLGRSRYLQGALSGGLVLVLLAGLGAGWQSLFDFPHSLLFAELSGAGHMDVGGMANFRAFLHIFLGLPPKLELALTLLAYLASLLAIAWTWMRLYPRIKERRQDAYEILASACVLLILAFSVHVWIYDYLSVLIPCFWLSFALLQDSGTEEGNPPFKILLLGLLYEFPILTFPSILILLTQGQGWWVCSLWSSCVLVLFLLYLRPVSRGQARNAA